MEFIRTELVAKNIRRGIKIFKFLYHWILRFVQFGKKMMLPSIKNPLLLKSATLLAEEIREGKISSEDVVRSYIYRIQMVEPFINAVVDERFSMAIKEAKAVDALIASGVETKETLTKEKPLLGVPFTVKVLLGVKGLRCTAGCLIFKDLKAHEDADSVALMKNAGAICIANTNSPEFGMAFETYNNVHGITSNPYDTRRTCGGSSGGEGAVIGSAGSVIGLGNDLAGSVRFPAFNCCIFGHKPTAGLISNKGTFPVPPSAVDDYLVVGPMCRYAEDLLTMMKILTGSKSSELKIGYPVDFKKLKIYYMLGDGNKESKINKDIVVAIEKVLHHFEEKYDNKTKEVQIHGMRKSVFLWTHIMAAALGKNLINRIIGGKFELSPILELIKFIFRRSKFTLGPVVFLNLDKFSSLLQHTELSKVKKQLMDLDKEFGAILDNNSVLIFPTFPDTAQFHKEMGFSATGLKHMAIFNILGNPVTQCPMGLSKKNLPVGFQVIGAKGCDNLTLSVAVEIEKVFGGWVPPCLASSKPKGKYVEK